MEGRCKGELYAYMILHINELGISVFFFRRPSCVGVLCIEDSGCDYGLKVRCVLLSWQRNSEVMPSHVTIAFVILEESNESKNKKCKYFNIRCLVDQEGICIFYQL